MTTSILKLSGWKRLLQHVYSRLAWLGPMCKYVPDADGSDYQFNAGACRYMVVLRSGGVYADIDVECRKPLNSLIMPRDTLIVGWENEFSAAEEARNRKYVRKRQVGPLSFGFSFGVNRRSSV